MKKLYFISLFIFVLSQTQEINAQSKFSPNKGIYLNSFGWYGEGPKEFGIGYRINKNFNTSFSLSGYGRYFNGTEPVNRFNWSRLDLSYTNFLNKSETLGYELSAGIFTNAHLRGVGLNEASFVYRFSPSVFYKHEINDKLTIFPTFRLDSHHNSTTSSYVYEISIPLKYQLGRGSIILEPSYRLTNPGNPYIGTIIRGHDFGLNIRFNF